MILLDTCTLLWLSENPPRLPESVIKLIRNTAAGHRYVSAITAFEIGVKCHKGKLVLPKATQLWFSETISQRGLCALSITDRIAFRAAGLPGIHRDPADRIIIATALEYNLVIVTPDDIFMKYPGIRVNWE
jgi:PIN domain nuclease of toxin-antitoxin system